MFSVLHDNTCFLCQHLSPGVLGEMFYFPQAASPDYVCLGERASSQPSIHQFIFCSQAIHLVILLLSLTCFRSWRDMRRCFLQLFNFRQFAKLGQFLSESLFLYEFSIFSSIFFPFSHRGPCLLK